MSTTASPTTDHEAAFDVIHELTRTLTTTLEKWQQVHGEDQDAWRALRDAFVAVRMTAEIGEEVCSDVISDRHLSVAPTEE